MREWKLKYYLFFASLIFFALGFLTAISFIKPVTKITFAKHCIISEFIQMPNGKQAIVYKGEK